ncbi:MAG: hypothetical protein IT350_13680 [Deltaproteobacteria bacterium]|nr:hypothetical protein [Deltaproteobacteria bacterium]
MRLRARRRLIALAIFFTLVGALEIAARVAMSDVANGALRAWLMRRLGADDRVVHESLHELRTKTQFIADPHAGYRHVDPTDPSSRRPPFLPAPPKAPGEVRVLCVGDSVTFGNSWDDSWPGHLQVLLDADAPGRYVVLNGATPGHNPVQVKRLLQGRWMALEPDIVVWYESPRVVDRVELPAPLEPWRLTAANQIYRSRLLYAVSLFRQSLVAPPRTDLDRMFNAPAGDVNPDRNTVLPGLIRWLRDRDVRGFVAVDYLAYMNGEIRNADSVRETAPDFLPREPIDSIAFGYVSALDDFRAHAGGPDALFTDWVHLTPAGKDLIAAAVRRWIVDHTEATAPDAEPSP